MLSLSNLSLTHETTRKHAIVVCHLFVLKDGNPFKPFWDELEVDFDDYVIFHLGLDINDPYIREQWQKL